MVGTFILRNKYILGFVETPEFDLITFNKITRVDKRSLITINNKMNNVLKRVASISEGFPSKKSQNQRMKKN